MEPIEINAGTWYLRALRADDRVDDRPALAEMGLSAPRYVEHCALGWAQDVRYTWAVCEPSTGEMLAEVSLTPSTGGIGTQARPGYAEGAEVAADTVRRFAAANGLGSSP